MTKRFRYDDGVWDNNVEDMADALLSEKECCDLLNHLHEENIRLKSCELYKENQRLIKMLDNVVNYMQKEHRDMPIDYFVDWWNKIATEGLDD